MDHSYYIDRISGYSDGELRLEEMAAVEEHLQGCDECREMLERFKRLDAMVDEQSELADADYWEHSAEKIEEKLGLVPTEVIVVEKKQPSAGWWKWVAAAASVAALTFIGLHQSDILDETSSIERTPPAVQKMMAPSGPEPANETETVTEDRLDDLSTAKLEQPEEGSTDVGEKEQTQSADYKTTDREESVPAIIAAPRPVPEPSPIVGRQKSRAAAGLETVGVLAPADKDEKRGVVTQDVEMKKKITDRADQTITVKGKADILDIYSAGADVNVSQESVQHRPVQNVEQLLESVPGVETTSTGEVFVRGGRAGEVNYIVDGVPVGDSLGGVRVEDNSRDSIRGVQVKDFDRLSDDRSVIAESHHDIMLVDPLGALVGERITTFYPPQLMEDGKVADSSWLDSAVSDWLDRRDELTLRLYPEYGELRKLSARGLSDMDGAIDSRLTNNSAGVDAWELLKVCLALAENSTNAAEVERSIRILELISADSISSWQQSAKEYLRILGQSKD